MNENKYFEYERRINKAYEKLQSSYKEVKDSYVEMIFRLALAAEYKDESTGTHLIRIADYCTEIAHSLNMSEDAVELLKYASPMHDIGKLVIPDEILKKPSGLTPPERELMKKHTVLGAKIFQGSRSPILKIVKEICLTHHERWDGTGYPNGLKGKKIPLNGRIVGLADVFDALTSVRPYKEAFKFDVAIKMITENSGTHFDSRIVDAFMGRLDNVRSIWKATKDIEHFIAEKKNGQKE